MAGNVVVDEPDPGEEASFRMPAGWFLGLGAAVVMVLVLLPGQPDATVPSTTVPFPEVPVEEDRWRPVDLPGRGALEAVAVLSDGSHVAVGDGPQVWRYDGQTWEWALPSLPAPGKLVGVAPYWSGAVAVGVDEVDGSTRAPLVWRTTDGVEWKVMSLDVDGPAGLDGVFVSGSQAVAWGWQGTARDYDPGARPLLLRSLDGQIWSQVDIFDSSDRLARIFTVAHHDDVWYVGGYATGRPALWESDDDLETWSRVDTRDLPFGWAVADVSTDEDGRVVTLVEVGEGRHRRWAQPAGPTAWYSAPARGGDEWNPLDERPRHPVLPVADAEAVGVGAGSLWIDDEGVWQPLDLSGRVTSASGQVAVGAGPEMKPRVWIQDGRWPTEVHVPQAEGGRWEERASLGPGGLVGAWSVADGWVVGSDSDRWWYVGPERMESFTAPWKETLTTIVPAGDEWVALPSMHWTSDGVEWEPRSHPWLGNTRSQVEAVTETDRRLLAVGRDSDFLWNVAASTDGGRGWTPVDQPMPATPLWSVTGIPDGFVATAARSQGTEEVVMSANGRAWETVTQGSLLPGVQPPAALTDRGTLLFLDTGQEIQPPRTDITSLVRDGEELFLVAGGRLWVGDGEWEEIPLDPTHGMDAGRLHLLAMGEGVLAVGADQGQLLVYEWRP